MQVLQAVAEAANEQGNCYPSLAQFAAAARMSRSNAWRTLKHLRQERWIVTNRILGRGGVLILQINLQKLAGVYTPGVSKVGRSSSGEAANSTDSKHKASRKSSQPVDARAITLIEPDAAGETHK